LFLTRTNSLSVPATPCISEKKMTARPNLPCTLHHTTRIRHDTRPPHTHTHAHTKNGE
jgi:hypothetical protein